MGQIEYLSQSDDNVDFLSIEEKYKFIDDLSILEMLRLAMCGISSYNFKQHVAKDIEVHGQYLPAQNIQYQLCPERICQWTKDKQMELNATKTKCTVIIFTNNFQFNTSFKLRDALLEVVKECRLLCLTLTNQLSWHQNTQNIVKKANTHMIILQKLYEFNLPTDKIIGIFVLFIRCMHCAVMPLYCQKCELFPTVVEVDIPFSLTVRNCSVHSLPQ